MTDDSETVRLSDRVMAGRHPLTDQARRGEIRAGEEEGGRGGKPGSFVVQSGEIREVLVGGGGDVRRNRFRSAGCVARG